MMMSIKIRARIKSMSASPPVTCIQISTTSDCIIFFHHVYSLRPATICPIGLLLFSISMIVPQLSLFMQICKALKNQCIDFCLLFLRSSKFFPFLSQPVIIFLENLNIFYQTPQCVYQIRRILFFLLPNCPCCSTDFSHPTNFTPGL